jgi:hypothetical protein
MRSDVFLLDRIDVNETSVWHNCSGSGASCPIHWVGVEEALKV